MNEHHGCPFCDIIAGYGPATVVRRWEYVIAIRPLRPVTAGHILVIPHEHVADVGENPEVSARTMEAAAELAAELADCNVITSRGAAATQTVGHLHLHVVPRNPFDGLALPWTQRELAAA
jgi:histidine triad (HIT) family protein